jgi:hypothetical protein
LREAPGRKLPITRAKSGYFFLAWLAPFFFIPVVSNEDGKEISTSPTLRRFELSLFTKTHSRRKRSQLLPTSSDNSLVSNLPAELTKNQSARWPTFVVVQKPARLPLLLVELLDKTGFIELRDEARIGELFRLVAPDVVARHRHVLEADFHPRMIGIRRR